MIMHNHWFFVLCLCLCIVRVIIVLCLCVQYVSVQFIPKLVLLPRYATVDIVIVVL